MTRYEWPDTPELLSPDDSAGRRLHNGRLRAVLEARAGAAAAAAPVLRAAPPTGTGPVWVPIGPTTVLNGQAADSPRVGGRVRDVWVSKDGKRAYAAGAGGGVWYTDDWATTWRPLGGWAVTTLAHPERAAVRLSTGALHVVFGTAADGSGDVVAVGTGELAPYRLGTPGGKLGGIGVLLGTGPANRALFGEFDNPWTRVASNLEGFGVYRIAMDPDDASRYVVASSLGLHSHSGASTPDETWPRVAVDPFNIGDGPTDHQVISDVVWVPRHDGDPSRLFVAWFDKGVWLSEHGTTGPFEKVSLPGSVDGRLGLAMAPSDPGTVYVLGQGPKLWRIRMTPDGPKADKIDRVPKNLFGTPPKDQSDYDLAIAVDPADSRRIVLGGAAAWAEGDWNAALVRCRVSDDGGGPKLDWDPRNDAEDATATPSRTFSGDPTWIGLGVHPDVHAVRYVEGAPGHELWIACDGGLFRSRAVAAAGTSAGDRGTFVAVNSGLAVLQPGYVASHPVNDVSMAAGTQDNGTIVRVGVGTWAMYSKGDGGGVVFHPGAPDSLAYQYTGASWRSKIRWSNPVWRRSTDTVTVPSERAEDQASSFYSGVAVLQRTDGTVRLAVGTNRVWLSDNWNPAVAGANSWATLPHNTDPRAGNGDNTGTDVQYDDSDGKVVALRWMSEHRLLVLMRRAVLLYRHIDVDKWRVDVISDKGTKCNSTVSDDSITSPSDYLPPVEGCEFSDIAVHDANQGARGSFYVATTSARDYPHMDTLWWFDGGLKWYRTGLRDEGVPAPAYAVAVDHTPGGDPGVVYAGTGTGVWRGEYVPAGGADPPDWTWTRLDNGLPEAAVQDLTVERFGDRLLLRAALQSRGVWELELGGPAAPKTYLQSAAFDGRRGASSAAATQFPTVDLFTPMSSARWFESPDVQVRAVPGTVPPLPAFPITESNWNASQRALWQFQVALHNVDPACRPVGRWTASFGRSLKAYRTAHNVGGNPVPPAKLQVIDADVWAQVMVPGNVFAPMWDGLEPTEADLLELVRRDQLLTGSTSVLPGLANVDVLVHHRDSRPVAAADVRVTLLRRAVTALPADWDALRLEAAACTALVGALTTNAAPAMPAPWAYADLGTAVRQPNADVDARSPRPVTFRIDAGAAGTRTLLLAAVSVGGPEVIATSAGVVRDLVRADHHLAARIIQAV
jgi:hypothetical protein